MRGPSPTPTKLKLVRGNPGKRSINGAEPVPGSAPPSPPGWMDADMQAEWDRVTADLSAMGLLHSADRALLVAWCEAWAEFKQAVAVIRVEGRIATSDKGAPYQHPLVGVKNKAVERINRISQQFGLSPSARTRIQVTEQQKENPLDALLAKQNA